MVGTCSEQQRNVVEEGKFMTSLHEGPEADNGDLCNHSLLPATSIEAETEWILTPRNS